MLPLVGLLVGLPFVGVDEDDIMGFSSEETNVKTGSDGCAVSVTKGTVRSGSSVSTTGNKVGTSTAVLPPVKVRTLWVVVISG